VRQSVSTPLVAMAEEVAPNLKRGISSAGLQGKDAVREGGRHAQKNAGRPSRTARHHNQPIATRLFALGILLIALALVILTIATRLISALLILPIALRITLLMLLTIVLMLIVFALTRILLVLLAGVVRTLFVTHHFTPYRLDYPRIRKCWPADNRRAICPIQKGYPRKLAVGKFCKRWQKQTAPVAASFASRR
jgi:hypothetical protein